MDTDDNKTVKTNVSYSYSIPTAGGGSAIVLPGVVMTIEVP